MTKYQDDPNINHRRPVNGRTDSTALWIAGAVAAMVLVGLVAWGVTNNNTVADNNANRPAVTERSTTGSGAAAPVATGRANTDQGNPASGVQTKPLAKPEAQQPGSSAPATNR
jgi:negative regulator of sigma E activity